jgi:hypothetical protein
MSCDNTNGTGCGNNTPCGGAPENTAETELLPSQIENFTLHFFGTVTKTMIDGEVVWILPCNLEEGLPNNPRANGEGLACYFLRLFSEGIVGLTGPEGDAGPAGTNGRNAFTVTTAAFTQPSIGSPLVAVSTAYNPAIVAGTYVFIQGSGWYLVTTAATTGVIYLTLTKALAGAPATITTGKLVVPSGYPGESITGAQGIQGPQGLTGATGNSWTDVNNLYENESGGTDYNLQGTFAQVDFSNSTATLTLPQAGVYLITAHLAILNVNGTPDQDNEVHMKLRNVTESADLPGTTKTLHGWPLKASFDAHLSCTTIYTASAANREIGLFAYCDEVDIITAKAAQTTMTYVRIG